MQAFRIQIPGVLLIVLVTAPARQTAAAAEPAPSDHIARAGLLLKETTLPARDAAPLQDSIRALLGRRPPTLRDTGPIDSVMAFFCDADLPYMERTENLLLIAQWQRHAGLNDEAMRTLDAALNVAKNAYASQDPPKMGYSSNWGERIAHYLIEWNGDEDKVLEAVKLGKSVRMHHELDFKPQYTKLAAEALRHALVVQLVEHETTALGRARAWADAAIGYKASGDGHRAVAAAKRCVQELDRIPGTTDGTPLLEWDAFRKWPLEAAFILSDGGEQDLAKRALQHAEKGSLVHYSELIIATALLLIGEDAEARTRIEQYYAKIPGRATTQKEVAWMRESGWSSIASAYAERGDLEDAENALANIPAESAMRLRGVRFVGRVLLDRGDLKSREIARSFFTRHARLASSAEKHADEEDSGGLREVAYCAMEAARAGAIDAVETQFLPTLTPTERQAVTQSLAHYSTELSLEQCLRRFVTPQSDPSERVTLLGLMAARLADNDSLYNVERMILEEKGGSLWKRSTAVTNLAEHRQSLRHWERARELFERALACANDVQPDGWRAGQLSSFMVSAWAHGHEDLARRAAEQLIDFLWAIRAEEIEGWKPGSRARCVLNAKQLLEATARQPSETAVRLER